jgi:HEAT repeat protein/energy-coupling factor transporter ATP-binding protein EcfA2
MMSDKSVQIATKKNHSPKKPAIDWRKVCRAMLDRSLPANPLTTQPDGVDGSEDIINISLGLVETQSKTPSGDLSSAAEDLVYSQEEQIVQKYEQKQFLTQVLQQGKSISQGRKIAIIGESGTGKTLLLEKIAHWVLDKTEDVPIWITSSQLGTKLFDQYLRQKWLPQAANIKEYSPIEWQEAFEELLNSGRVWLLLDGVDERLIQLLAVAQQIRSWTDKVRIVITCRTHIWETSKLELATFDTYQALEFSYPEQVKVFIQKWFNPSQQILEDSEKSENLGEKLLQTLASAEKESIRQWVKNPLRLALLCRLWQRKPENLPNTRAELYKHLIPEFYQWKAEATATNGEQQQTLNTALSKLSLQAMQAKSFPYKISHRLVSEILGENTPLFRLVMRLGWLHPLGTFAEGLHERYYTFFDATFLEYFAAAAVEDWHFFLDIDRDIYRVFEPHWQQTILLWLGRENVTKEVKEAFIKALVEFDDRCGYENFYGKRAYFLAAAGLSEFSQCDRADEIILQLVKWSFNDAKKANHLLSEASKAALTQTHRPKAIAILVKLIQTTKSESLQEQIFTFFKKLGKHNKTAIAALETILENNPSESIRWQVAECLGTIDNHNQKAISTLLNLLNATSEEIQQMTFDSLEKIAKGHQKTISTLISLLRNTGANSLGRRIFDCLKIIARENRGAIATLVQLIRGSEEEGMRSLAAECLEKIDPGNPTAIAVLIQLLQSAKHEEIRKQAVYSLGEIEPGHPEAIEALVKLLKSEEDIFNRWVAVSSLGKIGIDNPDAIAALVELIETPDRNILRKEAIDSLEKIHPNHPVAITALVRMMQHGEDESIRREAAESLGKIDPANAEAHSALNYLLNTTYDEFTRRQAAHSLGKIDPGNLEAIKALIRLIQFSRDKDICSLAAESLGEVGNNNAAAIATLIRLIQSTRDKDTFKQALKSLGKIGKGNRDAITLLTGLLQSQEDEARRGQIVDSLIETLQDKQMMLAISALRDNLLYKTSNPDLACHKILWYCAQKLPYREFYQAWYFRPLPVQPEIVEESNLLEEIVEDIVIEPSTSDSLLLEPTEATNFSDLPSRLYQAILANPDLSLTVRLIYIDSTQLIDPNNPLIDIYDRMLAQNCPPFEYGVPDTMAKLRLYWNMLRRDRPDKAFIFVFHEDSSESQKSSFSSLFLEMLSKFEGSICLISEQPTTKLQHFFANEPRLVQSIVTWIESKLKVQS